jgi:Flp pilus assembly protein TadG
MRIRTRNQKGAAMVEYSLVILLFLTALYAIMEFGRFIFIYNVLAGATREGARYAIVHGNKSAHLATDSDVQDKVRSWAVGLDTASLSVTTTWVPGKGPGSTVSIQSSYPLIPMTGLIFTSPITIGSHSEMMISQ